MNTDNQNIVQQWHSDMAPALSLDGAWELHLGDTPGQAQVPGAWEAQGFPRAAEGPAVYSRRITVPPGWQGTQIQLQFDGISHYAEISWNDKLIGIHRGIWSPFALDVSEHVRFDADNILRVVVYKPGERFPLRQTLAGFLPDVMLMFGGIWQSVRLVAFSVSALSDIVVHGHYGSRQIELSARAQQVSATDEADITIFDPKGQMVAAQRSAIQNGRIEVMLQLASVRAWQPTDPALYTAAIIIKSGSGEQTALVQRTFGFRQLASNSEQLILNDEPIYARGVLNWGWYPEILCPAPDEATVREEFRKVRDLGFNLVKLCLYVPHQRYFEIADEEGMLLWLELPLWLPEITEDLRRRAPAEYTEIVQAVHHHPSIVIYSLGCELDQAVDAELMAELNSVVRDGTCDVLVCDNSGSGEAYNGLAFDFADFDDYHFYCDVEFFEPLVDHFQRDWRPPRPLIFGEFCDADDYRDLSKIREVNGGVLPWWLTEKNPIHPLKFIAYHEQQARLQDVHLSLSDVALQEISRQQSFTLRKTILEKARARAGMGGYVVTSIRDTPVATSGLFDDFGVNKHAPEAFSQFNADSVLLLGRGRRRVWQHGGDRPTGREPYAFIAGQPAKLEVILSHAGRPFKAHNFRWQVSTASGETLAKGVIAVPETIPAANLAVISSVTFTLPSIEQAAALHLEAILETDSVPIRNQWTLWVFPQITDWQMPIMIYDPNSSLYGLDELLAHAQPFDAAQSHSSVVITSMWDEAVSAHVRAGGSAVLFQQGAAPLPAEARPFWREAIKIIEDHLVMHALPHEGFVDLQFYGIATDWAFKTHELVGFIPDLKAVRPLLRRLDARIFAVTDYLLELEIGQGKLFATTLRFQGGLGDQPAGLKFQIAGRWLLLQLLRYAQAAVKA